MATRSSWSPPARSTSAPPIACRRSFAACSRDAGESSGLRCILDIDRESRAVSVEFALIPGPPAVHRLFEITRTAEGLHFIEPIEG
jgi:hypothetical protein